MPAAAALALVAAVLAGCGSAAPRSDAPPAVAAAEGPVVASPEPTASAGEQAAVEVLTDDDLDAALRLYQDLADAANSADGDCDTMGQSMQLVIEDNRALLGKMRRFANDPAVARRAVDRHADEFHKAAISMLAAASQCREHEGVGHVLFEELGMRLQRGD